MNDLIVYLNVLSIYGRLCHNLTTGSNFFQDHEFFLVKYMDIVNLPMIL